MSSRLDRQDEVPTIEVRVFRHGTLVHRELCESEEQASLVVDEWTESDGIECDVDGLSGHDQPGEVMERDLCMSRDADYPDVREADR